MYNFTPRELPGPGTGNLAFEPDISLPGYSVGGAGTNYPIVFATSQPVQVYYNQRKYLIGLAGEPAGSIVGQPLIDWETYLKGDPNGTNS